jgi:hypothetical protein
MLDIECFVLRAFPGEATDPLLNAGTSANGQLTSIDLIQPLLVAPPRQEKDDSNLLGSGNNVSNVRILAS